MTEARDSLTLTKTNILGRRVSLFQPLDGFRVSIDTVILAAAIPAADGDLVLDVGSGNGAAALCLIARVPGVKVRGLESQSDLVAMARRSAEMNGFTGKVDFVAGDLLDPPQKITDKLYNHVLANPPYIKANTGHVPTNAARAIATIEGHANLLNWLDFCLNMAAPKATITIVHRYDRLCEILQYFQDFSGQITILPLIPRVGTSPKRVIVQVTKGRKAPISYRKGFILHESDKQYTPAAEDILRFGKPLLLSGRKHNYEQE